MAILKERVNPANLKALKRLPALAMIFCLLAMAAQAQSATEYEVKAAFLFNFAKFVEWPSDSFVAGDAPLQICVLGQDPFGHDFEQAVGDKTVSGHRLEIVHPAGLPKEKACQIIFVAASEGPHLREILRNLRGTNVLTVGDSAGFARMGGIINFVLDDSRVRFEINLQAADRAHLRLSARLLSVATLIVSDEEIGN